MKKLQITVWYNNLVNSPSQHTEFDSLKYACDTWELDPENHVLILGEYYDVAKHQNTFVINMRNVQEFQIQHNGTDEAK